MTDNKHKHRLPYPEAVPLFEKMSHSRLLELAGIPLSEQADVDTKSHEWDMMIKDLCVAMMVFAEPHFTAHEAEDAVRENVQDWQQDLQHYMYMMQQGSTAMQAASKKLEAMLRADEKEDSSSGTSD